MGHTQSISPEHLSSFSHYARLIIPLPQIVNAQWQTCSKKQVTGVCYLLSEHRAIWWLGKGTGPGSMFRTRELTMRNCQFTVCLGPSQS